MGNAEDRAYWNRHARHYDRSMLLLGKPLPRAIELASEAVRGAARVLEVAAGTGLVTAAIARTACEIVATDYAPTMVAQLEARVRAEGLTNVRCQAADVYALPFEQGSFDAVVAANVLHLVPDLPGALAAVRRVTRSGGRLIAPTYCHDETKLSRLASRLFALTRFPGHRRFTVRSLALELESAGLDVTRVELIGGLIPIGYCEGGW
jgi:phosphatidylethanolamine/phosphatidyl-N-methylethanolamine N-methyltransferase